MYSAFLDQRHYATAGPLGSVDLCVGQRHYAVEAVFPYRAVSGPTLDLCMPAGKGR
jgi:hypothetical protein